MPMTERQKAILRGAVETAADEGLLWRADDDTVATAEELREIFDLLEVSANSWLRTQWA